MRKLFLMIIFCLGAIFVFSSFNTIAPAQHDTISKIDVNGSVVQEDTIPSPILKYFTFNKVVLSIFLIVISFLFLKILVKILKNWAERNAKYRITIKGLIPIIRIGTWVSVIIFIITSVFKPPMATILAFTATIGVAIGFASQDLLKNIFGGIIIIIDRPFKVGDKVKIGNYYGEIVEIGLRSTRLVTPDDNLVSVPNLEIMNQSVANANAGEQNCQVVTEIYLPYNIDTEKVKQIATEAAQVSRFIYLNKPIVVLFEQEKLNNIIMLKMKVKAYVMDIRDEFKLKSDLTEILTKELYKNNSINIENYNNN